MTNQEKALKMHEEWNGKLETIAKSHVKTREDLAIAYTPGVAEPCKVIAEDKEAAYKYTIKSNTIAVVSDGSAVLGLAKQAGADTMAIVNVKGSSIAREADMVVYTHAGPEISVASTKAYMVQVSIMYLIAFELAYANGKMDEAECSRYTKMLEEIPEVIEEAIALESKCQFAASKLINADSLLYIGRGLDYALSMEGSLKLKEISYIHSESYAAGELKHGTISLITEQMPVIAIATQKNLEEKTISNIKEVKSRGAFVVLIAEPELDIEDGVADIVIKLPQADQLLMPMVAAVPLQLIAYYTAVLKGNDVDKPRNLAKSVTVE